MNEYEKLRDKQQKCFKEKMKESDEVNNEIYYAK